MRWFLLCALLAFSWSVPSHAGMEDDDWYEIRSDNFLVYTNGDVEEVTELVRNLEYFRTSIAAIAQFTPGDSGLPFIIVAARDRGDFKSFFSQSFVVGVFSPSLRGYYAVIDLSSHTTNHNGKRIPAAEQILKHEYVHFFLRSNSIVRYPYWYEEGFAEYLSTLEYEAGVVRLGFPVAGRVMSAQNSVTGKLPSLEGLLASSRRDRQVSTDMVYAYGWLLVHHLHMDEELSTSIQDYLVQYNKTGDPVGTFEQVFGVEPSKLKRALDRKLRKGKYSYATLDFGQDFPEAALSATLLERKRSWLEIARVVAYFNSSRKDFDDASELYNLVLSLDPNDVEALAGMAEIDMWKGDVAGAEAYLARIPENDRSELVLNARGNLLIAQAFSAAPAPSALDQGKLAQARQLFIEVLTGNPDSAEAYFGFGETFFGTNLSDTRDFLLALEQVYLMVPSDTGIISMQALAHLQVGQFTEARVLAEKVIQETSSETVLGDAEKILQYALNQDADGGRQLAFSIVKRNFSGVKTE